MSEFVTVNECKIHRENMNKNMDNLSNAVKDNSKELINIGKESVSQATILSHLTETVTKLDGTLIKLIDKISVNDTETSKNTVANQNNKDLIFKVVGTILMMVGWGIALFK